MNVASGSVLEKLFLSPSISSCMAYCHILTALFFSSSHNFAVASFYFLLDIFFFLQPVFKCLSTYFYHIFDISICQNRIMYIDFMFLKVSVYLSQQFHAFLPVSWKITLAPASPAESHLIGIGLKFRPVNIKNLFFQCLFILYIQIDFFRNGFYRFFQCVIDEAFKALVAGNEAVCDSAMSTDM